MVEVDALDVVLVYDEMTVEVAEMSPLALSCPDCDQVKVAVDDASSVAAIEGAAAGFMMTVLVDVAARPVWSH